LKGKAMDQVDAGMKLTTEFTIAFTRTMQGLAVGISQENNWPIVYCTAILARASIEAGCVAMKAVLDLTGEGSQYEAIVMELVKGIRDSVSQFDPERN